VTVCGRGCGRWATVVPVGGRHFVWFHARAVGVALPRDLVIVGEEPVVLVEILHAGVLVATHAQRLKPDQADRIARQRLPVQRRARDATVGLTVTRLADASGTISFAGAPYRVGRRFARQPVEVSIVAGSVQLAKDGKLIRVHPIRHDRSKELGAFANPKGRPRRKTAV
jgi:hypothetical protein